MGDCHPNQTTTILGAIHMWLVDSLHCHIETGSRTGESLLSMQLLPPENVAYGPGEGLEYIEAREDWSRGSSLC